MVVGVFAHKTWIQWKLHLVQSLVNYWWSKDKNDAPCIRRSRPCVRTVRNHLLLDYMYLFSKQKCERTTFGPFYTAWGTGLPILDNVPLALLEDVPMTKTTGVCLRRDTKHDSAQLYSLGTQLIPAYHSSWSATSVSMWCSHGLETNTTLPPVSGVFLLWSLGELLCSVRNSYDI